MVFASAYDRCSKQQRAAGCGGRHKRCSASQSPWPAQGPDLGSAQAGKLPAAQVAAFTSGRRAVSKHDCLLLQHVLWQRPAEGPRIGDYILKQLGAEDDMRQADYILQSAPLGVRCDASCCCARHARSSASVGPARQRSSCRVPWEEPAPVLTMHGIP